ncbi:MAG: AbrB/MazE/SpoVT family DNA-binding domain-containing protein [Nevskiales bacterium]|nr:AbrB/MazE/SpoVT family DNA-binding domain-containing protein [Nevskiales bacterium]
MNVRVAKWGNSLGVRVPAAVAAEAGLKPGTEVKVVSEGQAIRIVPVSKTPPRLEAAYKEMAKDEKSESQALKWSEELLLDAAGTADEAW